LVGIASYEANRPRLIWRLINSLGDFFSRILNDQILQVPGLCGDGLGRHLIEGLLADQGVTLRELE